MDEIEGIFRAARSNRADVIKGILETTNISPKICYDSEGQTPLHAAIESQNIDALRVLLSLHFPFEIQWKTSKYKQNQGITAYELAVELKRSQEIHVFHQYLIQKISLGDLSEVRALLKSGIPANVTDGIEENNLLHWAIFYGHKEMIEIVLDYCTEAMKKIVINQKNSQQETPLMVAIKKKEMECIKLLIEKYKNDILWEDGVEEVVNALLREEPGRTAQLANVATEEHRRMKELERHMEEKEMLIETMKKTIETLIEENKEMREIQENQCIVDYVRKLKKTNKELEEMNIIQQEEIERLREEVRRQTVEKSVISRRFSELLEATSYMEETNDKEPQEEELQWMPLPPPVIIEKRINCLGTEIIMSI